MAEDETKEPNDEGVDGDSPSLSERKLSSIRSLDDTGTSSLTSFLTKPVPRKRTPMPEELPTVEESPPGAVEATGTPAPPEPHPSPPVPEPPRPHRRVPLAVALGLALVVAVAWIVVSSGSGSAPASGAESVAEAGSDSESESEVASDPGPEVPSPSPAASRSATDLAPLAVLPVTPPEILSQNTWARRNRAAEIRAEARALYATQEWQRAQDALLRSLQWDPSNTDAQRNVSRTFQQMHEMERAIAWARRAIASDPSDPRSHELLGDQLLMIGHEVEAAAAYRAGLEAAPGDARLRVRIRRLEGGGTP